MSVRKAKLELQKLKEVVAPNRPPEICGLRARTSHSRATTAGFIGPARMKTSFHSEMERLITAIHS
jgi:hypothetical protein